MIDRYRMASFKDWLESQGDFLMEIRADVIQKSIGYGPWRQANVYTKKGRDGRELKKSKETIGESYTKFHLLIGLSKAGKQFYAKLARYQKNLDTLTPKLSDIMKQAQKAQDIGIASAVRAAHDDYSQDVITLPIDSAGTIAVGPLNDGKHTILFFSKGQRVNAFASPKMANLMLQVKSQISGDIAA